MTVRLIIGDAREKLAELPDESVHCVVTSPPYFGLRDYGTASWEGGDPACEHIEKNARNDVSADDLARRAAQSGTGTGDGSKVKPMQFKGSCNHCGATRTDKQIGLEPTPAEFVAVMVEVFREVRRVLRKDGTLWLNLGDSYSAGGNGSGAEDAKQRTNVGSLVPPNRTEGFKPKNLLGIPWRVAFALQADGWYLRQDIIWAKPNPMPESVTDRCTKAHEYLFLLTRSPRYHYDAEAIREEAEYGRRDWTDTNANMRRAHNVTNVESKKDLPSATVSGGDPEAGRNRRSVWTVATQPFKEAHFATFPPDLIEPCIKAGCPKETCKTCGAAWRMLPAQPAHYLDGIEVRPALPARSECGHDTAGGPPGTVLDPFGGAGTTGLVADRLQRNAILIELNPAYAAMSGTRITSDAPLFAVVEGDETQP
jgi:DNA modification methylase